MTILVESYKSRGTEPCLACKQKPPETIQIDLDDKDGDDEKGLFELCVPCFNELAHKMMLVKLGAG